mmetsp:Transcript_28023/g.90613  ORF Transcript_28023/g.90613 Transcript_28023/m.90613 type:complete len:214 (+) Transcript_28023:155-796(+)|eukprot:scaffold2627_cov127-Isochrysis_galbana.AAC.2
MHCTQGVLNYPLPLCHGVHRRPRGGSQRKGIDECLEDLPASLLYPLHLQPALDAAARLRQSRTGGVLEDSGWLQHWRLPNHPGSPFRHLRFHRSVLACNFPMPSQHLDRHGALIANSDPIAEDPERLAVLGHLAAVRGARLDAHAFRSRDGRTLRQLNLLVQAAERAEAVVERLCGIGVVGRVPRARYGAQLPAVQLERQTFSPVTKNSAAVG